MSPEPPETSNLRLFADHGSESPLWGIGKVDPATLSLSRETRASLKAFAEFFNIHCLPERGWDEPASEAFYVREGERLTEEVRAELGPAVTVTFIYS